MFFFFFFLNDEERIGFKKLTKADVGLSTTSNQTHIGLYEGVLDFLDNTDVVKSAMLIYNTYCDILDCSFDRIENPDGTFRSPKIRVGLDETNSIVSMIRKFVSEYPKDDWYLAWTGLESKELVFWLIKSDTEDYRLARAFFPKDRMVLSKEDPNYEEIKDYLMKRINFVSYNVQKDIEIKSQVGDKKHLYKRKDLEKANDLFKETGRKGEELINQYLEKEKSVKNISSFDWVNKSKETGLPYDFIVNGSMFVDVKSTRFDFGQYLFYSNQEIEFASLKNINTYSVYRVYDMDKEAKKFSICSDCSDYVQRISSPIKRLQADMDANKTLIESIKIGVKPNDCFIKIQDPIIL